MNFIGLITLVAYLVIGGLAFSYGYLKSKAPLAEVKQVERVKEVAKIEKEARAAQVPPDEPIYVALHYAGQNAAAKSEFLFTANWGTWRTKEEKLELASGASGSRSIDLEWGKLEISPLFTGKRAGHYRVKLSAGGKQLAGFTVTSAGKPPELEKVATPGYELTLVLHDPERRVTCYRVRQTSGGKRKDVCGILLMGKGWAAVEDSKIRKSEHPYDFPEIEVIVLPREWMEGNDISHVLSMFKRGRLGP